MPRPAIPQAMGAARAGTLGASTSAIPMLPTATNVKPIRTRTRRLIRRAYRAWIQEPAVQVIVAAVSAKPANEALRSRIAVSASGMKASTPKKARLSSPTVATAAGSPGAARVVPAGIKLWNAGQPRTAPATTRRTAISRLPPPSPARSRPAPTASWIARASRRRSRPVALPPGMRRRAGSASTVATSIGGTRPRKTQRHPMWSATRPESAGPTRPGTTQALDIRASILGFAAGGSPRPTAT